MKIKIHRDNREKLEAALKAENGRADTHTITSYEQLATIVRNANQRFDEAPKRLLVGVRATADPSGDLPNSYRYQIRSTEVVIECFPTGWFLVGITSVESWPGHPYTRYQVPQELRHWLVEKALIDVEVREQV